ncbi:hypothetical protein UY3_09642 [Chelonia mydas]|uniref:Uncharacterized protein n=1 Tax=Chelonia mydas TaxID=8469 RepID=M7BMG9_CHEMY|nr:hypothetical protein UY3_09642 [Chelonia mydas]
MEISLICDIKTRPAFTGVNVFYGRGNALPLTQLPPLIGGGLIMPTGALSLIGIERLHEDRTVSQLHRYSCAAVRSLE